MKKLLVTNIGKNELNAKHWNQLKKIFETIVFKKTEDDDLIDNVNDAEAIFSKFNPVDKSLIQNAPDLKYIGVFATGYGKVNLEEASKRNIVVTNVPGYSTESVAEFTIGVLLEHLRELNLAKTQAKTGNYSEDGFSASEIKGKKIGIIGLGQIGTRVAELFKAFGANVNYWSRNKKYLDFAQYHELGDLMTNSEIISLHITLTTETEGIITESLINKVRKGSIIINTSPIELFDFSALTKRLKKGDLTLIWDHPDEMSEENLKRLTSFSNCVTYPPIGYITDEANEAKKDIFVKNVESFVQGEKINSVN